MIIRFSVRSQHRIIMSIAGAMILVLGGAVAHAAPRREAGVSSTARPLQTTPARREGTALVYGAKIHYVEAGSGPVVVLLHGLGGDATNWAFNVAALAQKYRVIVPDQIGFGKSDKPLIN